MDWNEVQEAQSEEELRKAKLWLFQENIRIENEKNELKQRQDKFIRERAQFRSEMDALNHKMVIEQKRIREENLFFDKKMAILQDGFRKLEEDRKSFEREKRIYDQSSQNKRSSNGAGYEMTAAIGDFVGILFRGADNPLALRKRYRDLVKIFHPDNYGGDEELVQMINREFSRRKEE